MNSRSVFASTTPPDILEFFESWEDLPMNGLVPSLSNYLDNAKPHLQPNVTIVDVLSQTHMVVRLFGTRLESVSGLAPTANDLMLLYSPDARTLARTIVWETVTRPVGYVCTRKVRTKSGLLLDCPAIGLPIAVDDSAMKCFITYSSVGNAQQALEARDSIIMVEDIIFEHWVDIGAGEPEGRP
ncbi:MAG: hypothetical protein JNM81_10240 [Rhodospirillaceae bacterium]|nr:hypothetical protein [Rhodospirillaceae bacterium]